MKGTFINAIVEERMKFYRRLVARRPSLNKFMRGWTRRSEEFIVETQDSYIAKNWIDKLMRLAA